MKALRELQSEGRIAWAAAAGGWVGRPDEIVGALAREGFAEFKADAARSGRGHTPTGGLWQGLDTRTGAVASAIWVHADRERAVVFVDVDGEAISETTAADEDEVA